MALAPPPVPPTDSFLAALRGAREVAGSLRARLRAIIVLEKAPAGETRDRAVEEARQAAEEKLGNLPALALLADEVQAAAQAAELARNYNAEGIRIASSLRDAEDRWPSSSEGTETTISRAKAASEALYLVVKRVALLTTVDAVRTQLNNLSTGEFIDYGDTYGSDEYLESDDHPEQLTWLAKNANTMPEAWVEVESGRIYKLPPRGVRRLARYAAWPLWLVLAAGGVAIAGQVVSDSHPLGSPLKMLGAFGLVLAGVLVHFVANAWKRKRLQEWAIAVPVVSDWTKWWLLHPLVPFGLLIAPVVTLVALALARMPLDSDGVVTYLLAGYSADSIARAFIGRLDDLAAKTTKPFTERKAAEQPA